jgi:hypothetical protein
VTVNDPDAGDNLLTSTVAGRQGDLHDHGREHRA